MISSNITFKPQEDKDSVDISSGREENMAIDTQERSKMRLFSPLRSPKVGDETLIPRSKKKKEVNFVDEKRKGESLFKKSHFKGNNSLKTQVSKVQTQEGDDDSEDLNSI